MRDVRRRSGPESRFTVPDDFDVRAFAGRPPWEFGTGGVTTCAVQFAFPESRWVISRGIGRTVSESDVGLAVVEFDVRDDEAFLRWLLSFGRRAAIVAPVALNESLAALRAEVAAMYAESAP
jgi:hypothetical protein